MTLLLQASRVASTAPVKVLKRSQPAKDWQRLSILSRMGYTVDDLKLGGKGQIGESLV